MDAFSAEERKKQNHLRWRSKPENKAKLSAYNKQRRQDPAIREHITEYQKEYRERTGSQPQRKNQYSKYGITVPEYEAMAKDQQGVCAICNGTNASGKRLAIDHNHKTGAVRGLLCDLCNRGLGMFQDDLLLLNGAAKYLAERG